jgi:MFS family permease
LSGGINTPAWSDMIAKAIPPAIRGRWYGTAQFVGGALGAVALLLARQVLERYPFPINFALCFAAAAFFITASLGFTALCREPPSPPGRAGPLRAYLAGLPDVLRGDPNYARYLVGRLLLMLATLAVPFLAVYAVRRWHVEAGDVALYTSAMLVSQTVATLGWGWLIDRSGSKRVMELAGLAGGLSGAAALLAPDPLWLSAAFALVGISTGGYQVADGTIVIEFAPPHDLPRYVGLTNTALAPSQLLSPLLGGVIADRLGYLPTFGATLAFGLAGFGLLTRFVVEPRHRSR